jgi:hypothetical protein
MRGPHQIVEAIPMATRPAVASSGNSLLASHGAGACPAAGTRPAAAGRAVASWPLLTRRV